MLNIKLDNECIRWDEVSASKCGDKYSKEYINAQHYGHIIIDDFLPEDIALKILDNFPKSSLDNDVAFKENAFEKNKKQVIPYDCSGEMLNIFHFFNSAPFIVYLENLTGIKGIIGDHFYGGGGFHETSAGGKLGIHADFRIHPKLKLQRRINVIIYLNLQWDEKWKGNLELWSPDMTKMIASVKPIFNRCIIFNTESYAYHGHPEILETPEGITRKSMALYYYTASDNIFSEVSNISTVFRARPDDSIHVKLKAKFQNLTEQYLSIGQWMPPILYYSFRSMYKRVKKEITK